MFDVKMRARYLIRGRVISLWGSCIIPSILDICGVLCAVLPFMSIFYGSDAVLPELSSQAAKILLVFLSFMSVFMFFFSALRRLYFRARLYFMQNENSPAPDSFYNFPQCFRFIYCHLLISLYKLLWAILLFSPSAVLFLIIYSGLSMNGGMIKSIFITLLILFVSVFILGAGFYFTVTGKYFLCDCLLYMSPRQKVTGVISSSVASVKGRLLSLAYKRLCIIPWRIGAVFIVTLPYCQVFSQCIKAVTCEKLYGIEKQMSFSEKSLFISDKSLKGLINPETGTAPG